MNDKVKPPLRPSVPPAPQPKPPKCEQCERDLECPMCDGPALGPMDDDALLEACFELQKYLPDATQMMSLPMQHQMALRVFNEMVNKIYQDIY